VNRTTKGGIRRRGLLLSPSRRLHAGGLGGAAESQGGLILPVFCRRLPRASRQTEDPMDRPIQVGPWDLGARAQNGVVLTSIQGQRLGRTS